MAWIFLSTVHAVSQDLGKLWTPSTHICGKSSKKYTAIQCDLYIAQSYVTGVCLSHYSMFNGPWIYHALTTILTKLSEGLVKIRIKAQMLFEFTSLNWPTSCLNVVWQSHVIVYHISPPWLPEAKNSTYVPSYCIMNELNKKNIIEHHIINTIYAQISGKCHTNGENQKKVVPNLTWWKKLYIEHFSP